MTREDNTFESGWAAGYLRGLKQPKLEHLDNYAISKIIEVILQQEPEEAVYLIPLKLEKANKIAAEIFDAEEAVREAEVAYHEARYVANAKKDAARENCGHWATRYFPDASGNNDSETRCLICGVEVER